MTKDIENAIETLVTAGCGRDFLLHQVSLGRGARVTRRELRDAKRGRLEPVEAAIVTLADVGADPEAIRVKLARPTPRPPAPADVPRPQVDWARGAVDQSVATLVGAGLAETNARERVAGRAEEVRAKAATLGQGALDAPEYGPAIARSTREMRAWLLAEFLSP